MAISSAEFFAELKRNPVQGYRLFTAAMVFIGGLVVGMKAHSVLVPLHQQETSAVSAKRAASSIVSGFQPVTAAESSSWQLARDTVRSIAVKGDRLELAQRVVRSAEAAGLTGVRVGFGGADSVYIPVKPTSALAKDLAPADYTVVIDATGGFGSVLTFVNGLPPTVSLVRLIGARPATGATGRTAPHYQITLSVYEATEAQRGG